MSTTTSTHVRLRAMIDRELPELIAIRRDLHAHPELGYAETRTAGVVQRELEALAGSGLDVRGGLAGGTGVLASLPGRGAPDAPAVGLRADIDALPITEETGLPYASTVPGTMHACGHDGHTTILIGAARVLARIAAEEGLPRPVTLLFQPAEEGGGGGRRMVEEGCLRGEVVGPPVERMFGLHGWPRLPLGVVGSCVGPMLAAADVFEMTVHGAGAHAAFPHHGHDPVVAGAAIVSALQTIVSRSLDPLDAAVVSTTVFRAGTAHNVIPESAFLMGTVRTLNEDVQRTTRDRLIAIAEDVARAHGCRADVDYQIGYPVTANDAGAVDEFRAAALRAVGDDHLIEVERPFMGAEDFAFYGREVPACFYVLGLCPPGKKSMPDLHHPTFDFNDEAIATGVEMMCTLALGGHGHGG